MVGEQPRAVVRFPIVLWLIVSVIRLPALGQDVSLQLKTKSGRTEFYIGEVILLDFVLTADTPVPSTIRGEALPEKYPLRDIFQIKPASGWEDPLADYRKALFKAETSGHFPIAGSVLSANVSLSPEPLEMSAVVLNDYIKFLQPGAYTVEVRDSRVTIKRPGMPAEQLALTSNRLSLKLIPPNAQWQQNQLREALGSLAQLRQAIQSGARSYRAILADSCVTIRALGTEGAGAAMVDALTDEALFSRCAFQVGIWEFPNKRFILERISQLLKQPEIPITYTFFETMATTSLLANRDFDQLFSIKPRKIDQQLKEQILAVLPSKRGEAKTGTINTLVGISFARYGGSTGDLMRAEKISTLDSRVLELATDNFDQLSPTAQKTILNYRKVQHLN
jgi:hypothetical protein